MPFTYLGLPMGTTRPTVLDLFPLVCRVERRLSATLNMISYGGKLSLLNSVITSLIIFALCTLKLPASIIELLDKIRRKCLWTKKPENGDSCNSLAAWDMVCQPKVSGGLGVINIKVQSDALLLKYLHKFYNRWDLPWVELIWNTYYSNKIPHASDPCVSFWWRDVMRLMPIYRGITKAQVHTGNDILFWKDHWMDGILAETHPRAFSFATQEDISVRDFLGATTLRVTFHLPLSVQAHAETRDLQCLVSDIQLHDSLSGNDSWNCTWLTQKYSASKYYNFYFREVRAHQTYTWLWKSKVTMKIKVFGWLLLSDRLNTRNMLKRRHYNIGNDYTCPLCESNVEETLEHLFFGCAFSKDCWSDIAICWSSQGSRLDWISTAKTVWNKPMFMAIFLQAAWSIWKERNNKVFRRIAPTKTSWISRLKEDLSLLTHRVGDKHISFLTSFVATL
mgnify:FL=1